MTLDYSAFSPVFTFISNSVISRIDYVVRRSVSYSSVFYLNADVWLSVHEVVQQANRCEHLVAKKINEH
jgi:hypothetical protein